MSKPFDEKANRRLEFTQEVRERIIRQLTEEGVIPPDKGEQSLLLQAMDGLDKQELAKAKINVGAEEAEAVAEQAQATALVLRELTRKRRAISRNIETPDIGDYPIDLVPGETDIGTLPVRAGSIIKPRDS